MCGPNVNLLPPSHALGPPTLPRCLQGSPSWPEQSGVGRPNRSNGVNRSDGVATARKTSKVQQQFKSKLLGSRGLPGRLGARS